MTSPDHNLLHTGAVPELIAVATTVFSAGIISSRKGSGTLPNKRMASVKRSGAFRSKPAADHHEPASAWHSGRPSGWSGKRFGWDYSEVD